MSDIYFEKHTDDVLVYANRKGYKSLSTSLLNNVLMRDSREPIEILNLGGNKEQAARVLEYCSKGWRNYEHAREYLAVRGLQKNKIILVTGSNVEIVPASIKNVHGPSKNLLIIDEVDCFDDKERGRSRGQVEGEIQDAGELGLNQIIQGAMSVTSSQIATEGVAVSRARDRTHVGRLILLSTFHNPFGTMSKLVDNRDMLGLRLYKWCFLDVTEKCTESWRCEDEVAGLLAEMYAMRREKGGKHSPGYRKAEEALKKLEERCPLVEHCQGALKQGRGLFQKQDVIKARKRLGSVAFAFYWACRRPKVKDSVLETELIDDALECGLQFDPVLPAVITVDWGWEETAVQLWQEQLSLGSGQEVRLALLVNAWTFHKVPPNERFDFIESIYGTYGAYEIRADGAARDNNEQLANRGLNVVPVSFSHKKETAIEYMQTALSTGTLRINEELTYTIRQLQAWRRTGTGQIIKQNDHHADACVAFFAGWQPGEAPVGFKRAGKGIYVPSIGPRAFRVERSAVATRGPGVVGAADTDLLLKLALLGPIGRG